MLEQEFTNEYSNSTLDFKREVGVKVMALSATFNNISVISWRSALLVEKKPGVAWENHQPPACN